MIADLQTTSSILSNASPTAGSSAAQTDAPTGDTVALSAEGRQLAAAIPSPVLTEPGAAPSPIDATSAQELGEAVLVGTATTQSGRKVTIEQYNPATAAGNGVSLEPRTGYMVTIAATDQQEQQRFMLNGNTIINEDENGALHVSAYTPGQETDGNDIIIGQLATPLRGGAGDDTIFVTGDQYGGTIDAGAGNDTVMIVGNVMDSTISMGDGNDTLQTGSVFGGTISMGAGNDTLQATALRGNSRLNVDTGDGNDSITTKSIGGGQVNLNTGNGNDMINASVISMAEGQVNIDTGNGNDIIDTKSINMAGGQVNIDTGDGNDSVHANWLGLGIDGRKSGGGDSQVNITSGGGDDNVRVNWIDTEFNGDRTQVNIDTGDGNDSVHSSWLGTGYKGGKTQINIATGAGNDSVHSSWLSVGGGGTSQVNIDTGSGNDSVHASGTGVGIGVGIGGTTQVNIDTGSGNDVVRANWTTLSVSGSTQGNSKTGSGNDYVNAGIMSLNIKSQVKMEVMRDLIRETPADQAPPQSGQDGDALLVHASGIAFTTGGSAGMARRGHNVYRTQGQTDDATTGTAAQMHSRLRIQSSS